MPATYAHVRFGREVFRLLPESIQSVILSEPGLYDIGLHGPDFFFYYKPYRRNPVSGIGKKLHRRSGRFFFARAAGIWKLRQRKKEDLAYLYGYLCHFALDVYCHGYVNQRIEETGVSHTAIESDFDRFLLEKDGYEPTARDLTAHIHPGKEFAGVIAAYHPEADASTVLKCLKGFVFYDHLLLAPGKFKRALLTGIFDLISPGSSLKEHMIMEEADPRCSRTREVLYEKYQNALPAAAALIENFLSLAEDEENGQKWGGIYSINFESVPEGKKAPL